jgi:hypothetical protein
MVEFCVPIAALVIVTLAPGMPAPDASMTVPETLPRSLCAKLNTLAQENIMNIRLKFKYVSQLLCCVIWASFASHEMPY